MSNQEESVEQGQTDQASSTEAREVNVSEAIVYDDPFKTWQMTNVAISEEAITVTLFQLAPAFAPQNLLKLGDVPRPLGAFSAPPTTFARTALLFARFAAQWHARWNPDGLDGFREELLAAVELGVSRAGEMRATEVGQ